MTKRNLLNRVLARIAYKYRVPTKTGGVVSRMFAKRARSNKKKTKGKKRNMSEKKFEVFCITIVTALEATDFYILWSFYFYY